MARAKNAFQVLAAHFLEDYLFSAIVIEPNVFAIECKLNRLTIQNTVYRLKLDVNSVDVHNCLY